MGTGTPDSPDVPGLARDPGGLPSETELMLMPRVRWGDAAPRPAPGAASGLTAAIPEPRGPWTWRAPPCEPPHSCRPTLECQMKDFKLPRKLGMLCPL